MGDHQESGDSTDADPFQPSDGIASPTCKSASEITMSSKDFFSDTYKMDYPNRGKALIFNNRTFDRKLELGERVGTDLDASALYLRFTEMHFDVKPYDNVTVDEMKGILLDAAKDHDYNTQSDSFICTILSHGKEGVVFGTDREIEVKQLLEPFKGNNCQGLIGKPKIFFIQACQGSQFDAEVNMNVADAKGKRDTEDNITVHKIPSEADFLIAYSVVPGFFSWGNSAKGSWFVQALSDVLHTNWKSMDLLTMMTRVNKKVAYQFESRRGKDFMDQKKRIPCITSMLTKELKFLPKD